MTSAVGWTGFSLRTVRVEQPVRQFCDRNGRRQPQKPYANLREFLRTVEHGKHHEKRYSAGRPCDAWDRRGCLWGRPKRRGYREAETIRGGHWIRGRGDRCQTPTGNPAAGQPGVPRTSQSFGIGLHHYFRNCRTRRGSYEQLAFPHDNFHTVSSTHSALSRHDLNPSRSHDNVLRRGPSEYSASRISQDIHSERARRQQRTWTRCDCPGRGRDKGCSLIVCEFVGIPLERNDEDVGYVSSGQW